MVKIVLTLFRRDGTLGQLVMLGTLFGLIVLVFVLVLRFDPEARRSPEDDG